MNWYEQRTNEYESMTCKQIIKEFGVAGYGMFIILKQIIGQNMDSDQCEWGFVPESETMDSLAQKCGSHIDDFRRFIQFCDDRYILEKRNGRLFCPSILEEKNRYIKSIERKSGKSGSCVHTVHNVHTATVWDVTSTSTGTSTSTDINTGDARPQSSFSSISALLPAIPEQKRTGITTAHQDKAFRHFKDLGIDLLKKDISRVIRIFKDEASGKKYALSTDSVYSSLKDDARFHQKPYNDKLAIWFGLINHGRQHDTS